eukprot:1145190-Pelagomonas_calceolata.AAC.2
MNKRGRAAGKGEAKCEKARRMMMISSSMGRQTMTANTRCTQGNDTLELGQASEGGTRKALRVHELNIVAGRAQVRLK